MSLVRLAGTSCKLRTLGWQRPALLAAPCCSSCQPAATPCPRHEQQAEGAAPASVAAQEGAQGSASGALARQGSSAGDGGQQALLAQ